MENPLFRLLSRQKRFQRIHDKNQWGSEESLSGAGSTLEATTSIRRELPQLIEELGVRSMLDAPCGDLNWMAHILDQCPQLERYVGIDIVPALIERNRAEHRGPNLEFRHADIVTDPLPEVDLIFNRDCLLHLSFADAQKALRNFVRSGSRYLLTSTHPKTTQNQDIVTGRWRSRNLQLPPFNLPPPIRTIEEDAHEGVMGLWRLGDLPC